MYFDDKTNAALLSDDELLRVSGGSVIQSEQGEEIKEGRFVTSTLSSYSSGEFPKYSVGDHVKIKWHISSKLDVLCDAEIMGISEGRGGLLFRQYTYSVRILSCPNSDMVGLLEPNVHEDCLFR